MEGKFRLLLRGRERPGPLQQQTYAAEDSVSVRDLMTCVTQHVRAHELSPYRHTLILDGMEYQILNVLRQ
ncbi:MAG: hypothetical protein FIA96_10545 [Betaproteobacteria bacterium]|nr:hypothetical protein [Betaproteobacteria bacterium]